LIERCSKFEVPEVKELGRPLGRPFLVDTVSGDQLPAEHVGQAATTAAAEEDSLAEALGTAEAIG
jgi:hypothetical protein